MKTWRKYRAYKRIQTLWEEYKCLAKCERTRLDEKLDKLLSFLDTFQQAYGEFKSSSPHGVTLDSFYGDCSEVLVSLLDLVGSQGNHRDGRCDGSCGTDFATKVAGMVTQASDPLVADKLAEVIHKALSVAELILRDEKYKEITAAGPSILKKVLSLLETVETTEAKQLALRMVASIGNSPQGKLEIGRLDGFRKVLQLMLEKDQDLSKEALSTIQHFFEGVDKDGAVGPSSEEKNTTSSKRVGFHLPISPTVVWDTTKKVVSTVKQLVATEVITGNEPDLAAGVFTDKGREKKDETEDDDLSFPPSRRKIAQRIEEIELHLNRSKFHDNDELSSESKGATLGFDVGEDRMREFMCVQGALQTLTAKLTEGGRDVQLDVMATLSKLLRNSRRAQKEFRRLDGYALVQKLFAGIVDYSSSLSQQFLQDFFKILLSIIVDGCPNQVSIFVSFIVFPLSWFKQLVGNLDALELVFRLTASSAHIEVRTRAFRCVQDLLVWNHMNVVSCRKANGFSYMLQTLADVKFPWGDKNFIQSSQLYRLCTSIVDVLSYCTVLMSKFDSSLLEDITRLSLSSQQYHPLIRDHFLQCIRHLFRDRSARKLPALSTSVISEIIVAMREVVKAHQQQAVSRLAFCSDFKDMSSETLNPKKFNQSFAEFSRDSVELISDRENVMVLLLEIMASIVSGEGSRVHSFAAADGFELLQECFICEASPTVSVLAIWLILRFLGLAAPSHDYSNTFVRLLEIEGLSAMKKMLLLTVFRCWLSELCDSKSFLRIRLRDAGLVSCLMSEVQGAGPTVSREAFLALGCLVVNSEKLKSWLESKINFVSLSQIIIESSLTSDITVMEVVLQLAGVQQLEYIICPNILRPNTTPVELVSTVIHNISNPVVLFASQLKSLESVAFSDTFNLSEPASRGNRRKITTSILTVVPQQGKHHRRTASGSSQSSLTEIERSLNVEEDLATLVLKFGSVDASDEMLSDNMEVENSPHLWKYMFRSKEAAHMILMILIHAPLSVQRRVVRILKALLASNPANGQILHRMKGISFVLSVVHRCDKELRMDYLDLLAEMGMYCISPEETRLLFELGMPLKRDDLEESEIDEGIRQGILAVVAKIGQNKKPPSFFHLHGSPGWVRVGCIDRFPLPKVGYSMCVWLKVKRFIGEESTLLRLLHGNGSNILELFFQRIGANELDGGRCLAVRTQSNKAESMEPFAFNVFNAHTFAADDEWHLLVFTHASRTMSLYVDGNFVQSCSFTSYPVGLFGSSFSKEKPLVALFGGDPADSGALCADFSTINLFDCAFDGSIVSCMYEKGPLGDDHCKVKGESKPMLCVHPFRCFKGKNYQFPHNADPENVRASTLTDLLEDVMDRFAHGFESSPKKSVVDKKERHRKEKLDYDVGEMGGMVQPHDTRCLQDAINDVGGMRLALRLLSPDSSSQVSALQVLAGLLVNWEPNRTAFSNLKGCSMLFYVLSSTNLSTELFDVLFEICSHGERRSQCWPLRDASFALVISDLLPLCSPGVQRSVMRTIEDSNMTCAESLKLWMCTDGLRVTIILNFLRTMSALLHPVLLAVLQQLVPCWSHQELEEVMSFVIADRKSQEEVHCEVMDLVYRSWVARLLPLDHLRPMGACDIALCLLDHSAEHVRCNGLRTIGLLLDEPKSAKSFAKLGGFDTVRRILAHHRASMDVFSTLIQLSVGSFRCEAGEMSQSGQSQISWSTRGSYVESHFVHPLAVQVVLALLTNSCDEDVHCFVLAKIRMLLEMPCNAEVVLTSGGLDWCRSLLFPRFDEELSGLSSASPFGSKALAATRGILGRLFLFGLYKDPRLLKLKEMGAHGQLKLKDHEAFHTLVIRLVCEHLEREPLIPSNVASGVLRTLVQVLEPLTESPPDANPTLYLDMVRAINRVANHNTDAVRVCMKEARLLEVRDALLVHCLRGPRTRDGAFAMMQGLSFEWVAERPAFREANGLLRLLHIFHGFPAERDLQIGMGCVLRNVFGPSADNRRAVALALEDADVAGHLCPPPLPRGRRSGDRQGSSGGEDRQSSSGGDDASEGDAAEESARAMSAFLDWYYDAAQARRRDAVEARLSRLITAEEHVLRRNYERAAERRGRRRKAHLEATHKAQAAAESAFGAAEERRKQRMNAIAANVESAERVWVERMQERLAEGQRCWTALAVEQSPRGGVAGLPAPAGCGRAPPPSPMLSTQSGPRAVSRQPSISSHASSDSDRW